MEVQAQNTWKETIEKEAMARLNFQIPEWEDEDAWFDRTKYRPRGQPIILQSPGLSNPDFVPDPETLVQKPDEIGIIFLRFKWTDFEFSAKN